LHSILLLKLGVTVAHELANSLTGSGSRSDNCDNKKRWGRGNNSNSGSGGSNTKLTR
jgi:hypothetical protein